MQRKVSVVENAYRASVYSADLAVLFEDPANSYKQFVDNGNQKKLVVSGVTSVQVKTICNRLSANPNIERIHLFNGSADEECFIRLIKALQAHRPPKFTTLDLHNNKLSTNVLSLAFQEPIPFTCIDLSFNLITHIPEFASILSAPPLTVYLDNIPKIASIERIFVQLPTLTYCSLAGNKLESSHIEQISKTINSLKHPIAGLDLSLNNIGDKGCVSLCDHVIKQEFCALTQLSLQKNIFRAPGRNKLITTLESSTKIIDFKPEELLEEAEILRTEYPGKEQLTAWLQQNSLESTRTIFYKRRISLDTLVVCNLETLSKELPPKEMLILRDALMSLKNQYKNNSLLMNTLKYQSNMIRGIEVNAEIGSGFSSTVCAGTWQKTIPVVVKQFKQLTLYSIKNEFNILCYLKHPNIIHCYGHSIVENRNCLVFERGIGDYSTWSAMRQPVSSHQKLLISKDVCQGLLYLKSKRIVHRDLSLRNVIIFEKSGCIIAKLTDFGLSCFTQPSGVKDDQIQPHCDVPQGSLIPVIESSPEASFQHSTQSDIWALGILLWEMFEAKIDHREARRITSGRIPLPTRCPSSIYSIICNCLALDERNRYSIEEVCSKLNKICFS